MKGCAFPKRSDQDRLRHARGQRPAPLLRLLRRPARSPRRQTHDARRVLHRLGRIAHDAVAGRHRALRRPSRHRQQRHHRRPGGRHVPGAMPCTPRPCPLASPTKARPAIAVAAAVPPASATSTATSSTCSAWGECERCTGGVPREPSAKDLQVTHLGPEDVRQQPPLLGSRWSLNAAPPWMSMAMTVPGRLRAT